MTTKQAFAELIEQKNWWVNISINQNTAYSFKKRLKDNKLITEKKMREILIKAGYKHTPEQWQK